MSTVVAPVEEKPPKPDASWLIHVAAVAITGLAYALAPAVDKAHPAKDLSAFFSSLAQISATLVVAVALFEGPLRDPVAHRVRRRISRGSFVYLGLAVVCGLAGTLDFLGDGVYRYLLALGAGTGAAGLLMVLLVGATNIAGQRAGAASAQGQKLGEG
jgi:hypothetical protein